MFAYVTTWSQYIDEGRPASDENGGYQPFGNWSELIERNNVGGDLRGPDPAPDLRPRLPYSKDLTCYEDWLLYLELHLPATLAA